MSDINDKLEFDQMQLRNKLAEAASKIAKRDEETRFAMATEVVKFLSNKIEQTDLAGLFLGSDTFQLNETAKYELDGDVDAYIHTPGSFAPMTQPRNKEFTIPQEMISAHIMLPLQQLQAGRYGTIADQIDSAQRAIQGQVNKIVLDTVNAAVPSTSTLGNYAAVSGVSLTKAAIEAGINYIEDQTGGAKLIAGRRNKLFDASNFNTTTSTLDIFPESIKEDIIRRGALSVYRGLPMFGYKQYILRDGRGTLDNRSVYVVGQDVGRFATWSSMQFVDDLEVGTLNWHIHAWILIGAAVFFPERIYRMYIG